jgi:hypothetical protein
MIEPLNIDEEMSISLSNATLYDLGIRSEVFHSSTQVAARLEVIPAINGWKVSSATVSKFKRETVQVVGDDNNITSYAFDVLRYEVTYQRSAFVRIFTVMIMTFMWIMSIYLLVLSVDHVVFRPRTLEPDTVGFSVGMLFALPTLRMLLGAPLGSYIDYWSFAWNMLLVAVAVIVFFSGSYAGGCGGLLVVEGRPSLLHCLVF